MKRDGRPGSNSTRPPSYEPTYSPYRAWPFDAVPGTAWTLLRIREVLAELPY